MKIRVDKKTKIIIVILAILLLLFNIFYFKDTREISVVEYMPKKPMIKIFSTVDAKSKSVEIIDKIKNEFYQKIILDKTITKINVYRVDKYGYILVNSQSVKNTLNSNFIDEKQNINLTLLNSPIKKYVSWIADDGSVYKILSINENRKIMGTNMRVLKVLCIKDKVKQYIYFAKDLGIVEIDSKNGDHKLIKISYDLKNIDKNKSYDYNELVKKE